MTENWKHLTDKELIRVLRCAEYAPLIVDLCARLEKLLETNRVLLNGEFRK